MKSRSEIWLRALSELGAQCSVDTTRDAETLARRVAQEGDTFLKVALPKFAKDLELSLALECIPTTAFYGFKRRTRYVNLRADEYSPTKSKKLGGGIPMFLGGFLDLVFLDEVETTWDDWLYAVSRVETGRSDDLPSLFVPQIRAHERGSEAEAAMADAIQAVRQLCLMFGKEKELCSQAKIDASVQSYVETDKELGLPFLDGRADLLFEGGRFDRVKKVSSLVFGRAIRKVSRDILDGSLVPGHGPGSTSEGHLGNTKWRQTVWHDRLEYLFPYGEYALPNHRFALEVESVQFLAPSAERPAKLVAVAKTHDTPRLIAKEPVCMQYIQQAISRPLRAYLEADPTAKWFVGFEEQWPNQAMAQIGSDDGSLATLDLSEASDRVANWIIEELYEGQSLFLEAIQACRSLRVQLPSGEVHLLSKYASMGSALTFPLEAMVFTAIVIEAVLREKCLPLSLRSIMTLKDMVRVYGDDIIVPTDCAETVIESLEAFGLKVNRNKSFWTGGFRESCGKEYWKGYDVSIVRFRKAFPASRRDVEGIVSTVATRNLLLTSGLTDTAAFLDEGIVRLLKHFPYIVDTSPLLGRLHPSGLYQIDSLDETGLQAPRARGWVVKAELPLNEASDHFALLKCLLETIGEPNADPEHLTRSGRPRAVSIKLVKASPF